MYLNLNFLIDHKKKRSYSSDDSSDSDSVDSFSNHGTQSKTEQSDGASCSRTIDSDSNLSDDPASKMYGTFENNEKSNKGMSLMVIINYYEIFINYLLKL